MIREAYAAGWRVTPEGELIQPNGVKKEKFIKGGKYPAFSYKGEKIRVHRFAAYCFFGEELFKHPLVRHLDSNPQNFSRDNLALGTQKENMSDMPEQTRELLSQKRREMALKSGAKPPRANKLTDHQAEEIRALYSQGVSLRELGKRFGVHHSTIWNITTNKTFKGD